MPISIRLTVLSIRTASAITVSILQIGEASQDYNRRGSEPKEIKFLTLCSEFRQLTQGYRKPMKLRQRPTWVVPLCRRVVYFAKPRWSLLGRTKRLLPESRKGDACSLQLSPQEPQKEQYPPRHLPPTHPRIRLRPITMVLEGIFEKFTAISRPVAAQLAPRDEASSYCFPSRRSRTYSRCQGGNWVVWLSLLQ